MSKAIISDSDLGKHEDEVVRRWGNSQEFKESHTRTAGYLRAEFDTARLESDQDAIYAKSLGLRF